MRNRKCQEKHIITDIVTLMNMVPPMSITIPTSTVILTGMLTAPLISRLLSLLPTTQAKSMEMYHSR